MAAEDEDFDVEEWNRRLDATPSDPPDRPRLRTRHLDLPGRYDERHPARYRPADETAVPPIVEPLTDPFADPLEGTEVVAEEGFPPFEHGQWTVEGEIERFGAFGRGAARSRGWKRAVAISLLALLVLPLLLEAVQLVSRIL